ncbi:MAG: haloacid dehalogenase [Candidatus Tectimicrobiota bacterium]|nr:MAG: haloacid dehalogenase [Candidatus Tectomicrobia bacterium]
MRYRLLALDADGTVLDPAGELRPSVQRAVAAVQQRGVRVVLCTGRRFRTARPLAQALGLRGPVVVHNGALIKDLETGKTLFQCYLPSELYPRALAALRDLGAPLVYVDAFPAEVDILTEPLERAHPFQRQYLQANLAHCRIVPTVDTPPACGVIMVSTMADAPSLLRLRARVAAALDGQARVNLLINKNYQGHILEVLHPAVSKWQALQRLAAAEGIAPEEIVAIGDDENDIEMLRHAGLGIAMGNATPEVQAAAAHVTASNAEDGLVQALTRVFLS